MQHLDGSGMPILYIGRTVLKGYRIPCQSLKIKQEIQYKILKFWTYWGLLNLHRTNQTSQ